METELWEILVPASNNKELKFSYEHHKEWDAYVKKVTGGVTIMKTAKGEWISPNGKLYVDRIIPCRIVCTEKQISNIIDFTIEHYTQEAVLAYRIADKVVLRHKDEKVVPEPPEPPMSRILKEGVVGTCAMCGSTLYITFFGKVKGCIQPKCRNFWNVSDETFIRYNH